MFRVNNLIINEELVVAIVPHEGGDGICILVESGANVRAKGIPFDKVVAEMEREGLLTMSGEDLVLGMSLDISAFTQEELRQMSEATAQGYRYAAKDVDGKVFAYHALPYKGKSGWCGVYDDLCRLEGEFAALSWDDPEPLDIFALTEVPR